MYKILSIVLMSMILSTQLVSNSTTPILQLDPKGHTALVKDLIITKDQKIITASVDKSVRVWNLYGQEERKILGDIAQGGKGKVYAIALSPDQEYLAVGGYMSHITYENLEVGIIRLYHYPTGKLIKTLKSHKSSLHALSFSQDGKYLVSGSSDNSIKVWSVANNFRLKQTINEHKDAIYAVKIFKKEGRYHTLSVGLDNRVILYDLEAKKVMKFDKRDYKLHSLALSSKHIAVGGFAHEIAIYDYELNLLQTIPSKQTMPAGLAYSPNEKYLLAGTFKAPNSVNIYAVDREYKKITSFNKHNNTVKAIGFIDNNHAISVGGDNHAIYVWGIKHAKVLKEITGVGQTVWSVGVYGDTIAWGYIARDNVHKDPYTFQKSINLKSMHIQPFSNTNKKFKKIPTQKNNMKLLHKKGGEYDYKDAILELYKDDKLITSIIKSGSSGYKHNVYGFYKEYIVSAGSNGSLLIYNQSGQEIAKLSGHIGEIFALALDEDRLISAGADQSIRIWDLKELSKAYFVEPSFFNVKWQMFIKHSYPHIDTNNKTDIEKLYDYLLRDYGEQEANKLVDMQKLKFRSGSHLTQGEKEDFKRNYPFIDTNKASDMAKLYQYLLKDKRYGQIKANRLIKPAILNPTLNLFISKENEYVAWSSEGYFSASPKGVEYIYYHINQGENKEAKTIGINKLYDHFFRPDLIQLKLQGKDIAPYINNFTYKEALKNPPPAVSISQVDSISVDKDQNITTTAKKVKLFFSVNEVQKGGVGLIRIYQEGKLIQTLGEGNIQRKSTNLITKEQKAKDKEYKIKQQKLLASLSKSIESPLPLEESVKQVKTSTTKNESGDYEVEVELIAGNNEISIEAFNQTNSVLSQRESISIDANIRQKEPKIYAIVVGTNHFEANSVSPLKYSLNDAKVIKKLVEQSKGKIYQEVEIKYLIDTNATKDNIQKAIREIKEKIALEDTLLFYISTHGKSTQNGKLYLVPYNNLKLSNWIDFENLFNQIQSLKSLDQLFIVDACESGSADEIVGSLYDAKASVLAKRSGVHLLLATSRGTSAFEHPNSKIKHGVFTYSILQTLKDRAIDLNNNRLISIKELSKALKQSKEIHQFQYPIIRNVGRDIEFKAI
ncbi:MAG: caspase family protein [Campylobacterota bacterium]|nr:caspase family protein [Campylobacterota bacterium]